MKRSELKKLIKPIVRECVQETILNEGLLSNIVSEVAQGLGNQTIVEHKEKVVPRLSNENSVVKEQIKEYRKQLLDEVGKDAFNGVDLFEGTRPAAPQMNEMQTAGALSSQSPEDAGVDISGIMALGGKNWKALIS